MQKYQQRYGPDATSKPSKNAAQHLAEEVMGVRVREAEAVGELKETKQRVMELETQVGLDLAVIATTSSGCSNSSCFHHSGSVYTVCTML